jgi:hypothetical protein
VEFNPDLYPSWQKAGEYIVDSDRIYLGRLENGKPRVYLENDGVLSPLHYRMRLNPDSLDWTSDLGAMRLALCLMLDATWGDMELCDRLYEDFAEQVIEGLPKEGWRLRRDFIWAWIRLQLS